MKPVYINNLVLNQHLLSDIVALCLKIESFKGDLNVHFELKPNNFYLAVYDRTKTSPGSSVVFSKYVIKDSDTELSDLQDIVMNLNNVICYLADYYRRTLLSCEESDTHDKLENLSDNAECKEAV